MDWVVKRSGLNVEHAMDDGCVRLRGLPFGCPKDEISTFFAGMLYYRVISKTQYTFFFTNSNNEFYKFITQLITIKQVFKLAF